MADDSSTGQRICYTFDMLAGPFQEGFYAAFFSAEAEGYAVLAFFEGRIVGADPLGVKFLGTYNVESEGVLLCHVDIDAPPHAELIQGASAGSSGLRYSLDLKLPANFQELDYVRVETPLGPVNARFKYLCPIRP